MKWTNHDKLSTYGVKVVGWPAEIPLRNPSSLSASQNNVLFELLTSGDIKFVMLGQVSPLQSGNSVHGVASGSKDADGLPEDFSWACEDSNGSPSQVPVVFPSS